MATKQLGQELEHQEGGRLFPEEGGLLGEKVEVEEVV